MEQYYDFFLRQKITTQQDFQKAISISQKANASVEATLIKHFQVTKEAIGKFLSAFYNCQFIEYNPKMSRADHLFTTLNRSRLLNECWVPLSCDENRIVVLVDDPSDTKKIAIIKDALQTDGINFAVGIKEDVEAFINQFFDQIEIFDLVSAAEAGKRPIEVAEIVDIMFSEAYRQGASDIHFESLESVKKKRILFWMDGEYREYMTVPDDVATDILKRIKSMANLDVDDRRLSKIAYIKFRRDNLPEFRLTITTCPTENLREAVFLKIPTAGDPADLEKGGSHPDQRH